MANNRKPEGRPVTCVRCGSGGGTLVKISSGKPGDVVYQHQRPEMCRRKEVKSDEAKS